MYVQRVSWSVSVVNMTLMPALADPNTDPSMQLQLIALERDLHPTLDRAKVFTLTRSIHARVNYMRFEKFYV